ncbi:hypothetical protein QFC21_004370 [Naganishia friedmannii]|uniref:Uncharacterized protein n=1 Tax=Naganishia friedmannii TaxID=89922 RepID=A0ACC2VHF6_9TREE|nr:hypothetical protein QFC21_004370 [Naganishia friedmannii]
MAPAPKDYTAMTKREIVYSFSIVTILFFLWGFSYGLLDVLNAHSPPMGLFMRKYGYKTGIHVGLTLFSIGAVMFWPSAKYKQYGITEPMPTLSDLSEFRIYTCSDNGIDSRFPQVQYVYLAMSCLGVILNIAFYFAKLPEVAQVLAHDVEQTVSVKGFFKKTHTIAGFFAEFAYPGISPPISNATASNMFSACQAVFTVGRFIGVLYLNVCYPVIFTVATADLGSYAKLGSGLLSAGVSGGAAWPSMTGAVADKVNTHTAFVIPLIDFIPLMLYGLVMWITRSRKYAGRITIWQTQVPLKSEEAVETALAPVKSLAVDETKKGSEEDFVETVPGADKSKR